MLNLNLPVYLKDVKIQSSKKIKVSSQNLSIVVANQRSLKEVKALVKPLLGPWQLSKITNDGKWSFETAKGPLHIVILPMEDYENIHHEGMLDDSGYALARDRVGEIFCATPFSEIKTVSLHTFDLDYDEVLGAALGLEMGAYDFKNRGDFPPITVTYNGTLPKAGVEDAVQSAGEVGKGINISRHLVNVGPSDKRPEDYADHVKKLFARKAGTTIDIWDEKRLEKEGMGLILGVGAGSSHGPRMVHIKYRPKNPKHQSPIAFVGKGITFDTGGLNLKPGNSMRLMKKDMGGSATIVGLAYWAITSKLDIPCDFYLALAENSVDAHSFCPSDILTAKNGKTVEIDNTDAEGRLVMADVLCVATEKKGKDKPQYVIDVATLTGAIKVGLGAELAGLFSDDDDLAFLIQSCSQIAGDKVWRMPLVPAQRKKLNSDFADMCNSSSGFGGAIRAAMFLKEFTNDVPWAHIDIYGWNDGRRGPFIRGGGNGQMVQGLAQFLSQL